MKLRRYLIQATISSFSMASLSGIAMGTSLVDLNTTGPSSIQKVGIEKTETVTIQNTNELNVNNTNNQTANTGNVTAAQNTTVVGAGSGKATNEGVQTTALAVANSPQAIEVPGNGGNGAGGGQGNGAIGSGSNVGTGGHGSGVPAAGRGGGVLGASTGSATSAGGSGNGLPEVGASVPMDVSFLRQALQAPAAKMAAKSSAIQTLFLVLASLISLVGAIGSAVHSLRRKLIAEGVR